MTAANSTEISISELAKLATDWWRLDNWLKQRSEDQSLTAVRYVSRKLGQFIKDQNLSILDMSGEKFDAGLAFDVIETVPAADGSGPVIVETISPVIMWKEQVVSHGQVVISQAATASSQE